MQDQLDNQESFWQLSLTGSPVNDVDKEVDNHQVFTQSEDWTKESALLNKLSKNYWNKFRQCLRTKINGKFDFTIIEQAFFDYGLSCGEQFCKDQDVIEAVRDNEGISGTIYKAVYETLLDDIRHMEAKKKYVLSITEWVKKRYEYHSLLGEVANLEITPKLLKRLPDEYKTFCVKRDERTKFINSLSELFKKTPGINPELLDMLIKGTFHDELDYCQLLVPTPREIVLKGNTLKQLWASIVKKMTTIFQNKKVHQILQQIDQCSEDLVRYGKLKKVDMVKLRQEASNIANSESFTYKALQNELMIVKNNLNVGSMSSNRKQHFPLLKGIKKIPNMDEFATLVEKLSFEDRFYPLRNTIVLAPGDFNGFFEFDRESFILPLYAENHLEHLCLGMVSYRLMIESSIDDSGFMKDAEALFGAGKVRSQFKELYLKCFLNSEAAFENLNDEEKGFVYKHIALYDKGFFLNNSQLIMTKERLAEAKRWVESEKGSKSPGCIHQMAAQYFKHGKKEIAQKMLEKSCQLQSKPVYLLSLAMVYDSAGKTEEADRLVEKCRDMPLQFYEKLYIWHRKNNK